MKNRNRICTMCAAFVTTCACLLGTPIAMGSFITHACGGMRIIFDLGVYAAKGAVSQFSEVLNDSAKFDALVTEMDENKDGRLNTSFIGNVTGDDESEDSKRLAELFADALQIDTGNGEIPVTIMIKRDNVDGNNKTGVDYIEYSYRLWLETETPAEGGEFTIYMTADDVTKENPVTVYVAVFTIAQDAEGNPTGKWYQLGEMFVGQANTNNYQSGSTNSPNSFNTDTWKSTESYYGLGSGKTVEEIMTAYQKSKN